MKEFELREPLRRFPFVIKRKDPVSGDIREYPGDSLSLPVIEKDGSVGVVPLCCVERIEGPDRVLSSILYIKDPGDMWEDGIFKNVLSLKPLEYEGYHYSAEPVVEVKKIPWMQFMTADQEAWQKAKSSFDKYLDEHPIIGVALSIPFLGSLKRRWFDAMESKFGFVVCKDCIAFDRTEGLEEYNKITHRFLEGDTGQMNKDITLMCAQERGIRGLNESTLGYCKQREMLIEGSMPGCPDYKPLTPFEAYNV